MIEINVIFNDQPVGSNLRSGEDFLCWFDVGFSATRNGTKTIFLVFMTQNNNQRNYLFDNATSPQFCFIVESNSSSTGHMHAGVSNLQGNFQIKKHSSFQMTFSKCCKFIF